MLHPLLTVVVSCLLHINQLHSAAAIVSCYHRGAICHVADAKSVPCFPKSWLQISVRIQHYRAVCMCVSAPSARTGKLAGACCFLLVPTIASLQYCIIFPVNFCLPNLARPSSWLTPEVGMFMWMWSLHMTITTLQHMTVVFMLLSAVSATHYSCFHVVCSICNRSKLSA